MSIKNWIKIWFSILLLLPLIALLNYYIDPFWTFSHSNSLNQIQKPFNERQQKTNYIYFNGFDKYDGILLGSSRATYINQNDFTDMNIYNYSFNSSRPGEFKSYIDFAKELKGEELKYVVIGADLFGTKARSIVKTQVAKEYIANVKSFGYKYKTMLSRTTTAQSIKNILYSIKGEARVYYTRDNLKYKKAVSDKKRFARYKGNIKGRTNSYSDKEYKYDDNYIKTMLEIKQTNPNTEFKIYTSPVHANLLLSILKTYPQRMDDYSRWLRELVSVFGKVYHFMDISCVTTQLKNYPDAEHFYESVGKQVANTISGQYDSEASENFGTILDKDNIDEYLKKFFQKVKLHKLDIEKHTYPCIFNLLGNSDR